MGNWIKNGELDKKLIKLYYLWSICVKRSTGGGGPKNYNEFVFIIKMKKFYIDRLELIF